MKNLLLSALLLMSCLLTRPASSQPIAPLRPLVVRLDSGTVVRRPLIGIDTTLYRSVRTDRALDQLLLANRAARVAVLEQVVRRDSSALADRAAELRRCRGEGRARESDFTQLVATTARLQDLPTPRPFLLDAHTYQGAGLGALALLLVKIFVLH
ncbi:hypothetical protein [Hymenobacter nivis]|uniref:hypothetical protein n=1 Tax=Hymenobacter nivis TaxID=1850093 RepID=UPI0013762B49|nr:hypothetical protein [Hymenobacter nivis]